MDSCLYDGLVRHERLRPLPHQFQAPLSLVLLDLGEAPGLLRAGWLSAGRWSAGFCREDHLGDSRQPLTVSVRELVQRETGAAPAGPIRLLTPLRHWGCYFSPLNLFYCYGADGATLAAVVAAVQNTPWLERHCYVLWAGNQDGEAGRHRHAKAFHVSPFLDLDLTYRWRLTEPGAWLRVGIENHADDQLLFRASLALRRSPLSRSGLRSWRQRSMPARTVAAIYWQAFQLWRKGCPFYPHPKHRQAAGGSKSASQGSSPAAAGRC